MDFLFAASFVLLLASVVAADFRAGRATFFHSIHQYPLNTLVSPRSLFHSGSCGYGHLDSHRGTGWNVVAISDVHYEYYGSCGRCYEVRCRPAVFSDNYGNSIDRSHACYDPNKSIIVSVVDTCPCWYPWNSYSNTRWCCGDMDHLDLSVWAYDQLAEQKWGVIGISYKPVACPNGPAVGFYPQDFYGAPNQQQVTAFDGSSGRRLLGMDG